MNSVPLACGHEIASEMTVELAAAKLEVLVAAVPFTEAAGAAFEVAEEILAVEVEIDVATDVTVDPPETVMTCTTVVTTVGLVVVLVTAVWV